MSLSARDYRNEVSPVWCSGCGDYAVLKSFTRAFAQLGLPSEKIAMISGIGCSSRLPGYCATYGFNSIHGRALPIATGLKVARPELTVVVVGGDGDGFSIGGGHIPHTVRRNTDLTYLVMDNSVYGLTKGQSSPTTTKQFKKENQLAGENDEPLNPMLILLSYGAKFLARVEAGDMAFMTRIIVEAMQYRGFSFIHCLSTCVTYQGRSYQDYVQSRAFLLEAKGHNPLDISAAYHIAKTEPFAMGVIYRQS